MRLDDPNDELAVLVAEAAKSGPRTADRTAAFLAGVHDAAQSHRPWAEDELQAIQEAGARARFKRYWKPAPAPITLKETVSVDVQTVVGIVRAGEWMQLPMTEITPDELREIVRQRTTNRDRQTGELAVLRRLIRFVDQHEDAATIGAALTAASADLLDVMAGVA